MAGSDITVSSLVAVGDVKGVHLNWLYTDPRNGAIPNIALDAVEVWAATSNDRAHGSFAKIGEGVKDYLHSGLNRGDVRYYWIKARNVRGSYGDWHPSSATAGVVGTEVSGDVLIATNGYWRHPSGLIEQWGLDVVSGASTTITLPIQFPNRGFNISATIGGANVSDRTVCVTWTSPTLAADFQAEVMDSAGVNQTEAIYWRVIGY